MNLQDLYYFDAAPGPPPTTSSSDGLAGGEWDDPIDRDLTPQPPDPTPIIVPLPTWATRDG